MKKILCVFLAALLLSGCGAPGISSAPAPTAAEEVPASSGPDASIPYTSRFGSETRITLSDSGVKVAGPNAMTVFSSADIVYYEDRDTYESGNPYGEGKDADRHSAAEAAAHTVVNITAPGTYRVTGTLSAGQVRVDLGKKASEDPHAVVELILDGADITCSVAPAILFLNVYECDGNWDSDTATADVDTSAAGANLILEGENTVSGAYVAKIFKDKKGEKKLWKQDGAIYSYMSMNIFGPGALTLKAANEGIGAELHLTVNGGDITVLSQNDGINTNEDGVSVTTVNAGTLRIVAGLGAEGDGIDSNGYLVINGGTVISSAKPQSDAGLDSDLGSYIHGGTVIALGSSMDWAESDSKQVTMNLQFSQHQTGSLVITKEGGEEIFSFDPASDRILSEYDRTYQGAIVSCPGFRVGDSYLVRAGGVQQMYTSTDVMRGHGPGGMGGPGGQHPEGQQPADMDLPEGFGGPVPEGEMPTMPEGWKPADGDRPEKPHSDRGEMPKGETPMPPEGETGGRGHEDRIPSGDGSAVFYMQDKVNFFSGLTPAP